MKQDRFIELLNLYLDGALPSDQAAELEREIQDNPGHRQIYRQYCQMQRACSLLTEKFREEAAPAALFRQGRVVAAERPVRISWMRPAALVAAGAMAACFAFVLVRTALPTGHPAGPALAAKTMSAPAAGIMTVSAPVANPSNSARSTLARRPWNSSLTMPTQTVVFNQPVVSAQPLLQYVPPLPQLRGTLDLETGPLGGQPQALPGALQKDVPESAAFQYPR